MALKYSITHNGNTWNSSIDVDSIFLSNGSVTSFITAAGTMTLHCAGKYMPNNLVIGDKTLHCAGRIMSDNVVITAENVYSPPSYIGEEYTFDGKTWIAVHNDTTNNYWYLTLKDVYSTTKFRASGNAYAGSTLASVAAGFQQSMSIEALSHCVDVTTEGVVAKVFVATFTQMNGGFSYFNSDKSRIAQYNGINHRYWTSSASALKVLCMGTDGTLRHYSPSDIVGFRPSVCITY